MNNLYDNYDMENNMGDTHYVKIKQIEEENSILREEIIKLDDKNLFLERINACLKRQLKEDNKRHDDLQREYDKLTVVLDEVMEREKKGHVVFKKSTAERQVLLKKIETAELEAQEMTNLRAKLKEATIERSQFQRKLIEVTEMLDEESNKCELLQEVVTELRETNERLQNICESRENTIQVLREKNRELTDENEELKLLIDTHGCISMIRDSTLPNSDTESLSIHGISNCESNNTAHQISLFDELKASGFSNTFDKDDTMYHQLENQVHWYELEINRLLQKIEPIFEQLLSTHDEERFRLCVTEDTDYTECSEEKQNFERLKRRIQVLLDVFIETPKITTIGSQPGTNSEATGKLDEVFNPPDNIVHALSTDNGTVNPPTVIQGTYQDTSPVLFNILHKDENFTLDAGSAIIREYSQRLATGRRNSKRKNKAMSERDLKRRGNVLRKRFNTTPRVLDFTKGNIEFHNATTLGYHRSKSESNLIAEKKQSSFLRHSVSVLAVPLLLEKMDEAVEKKKQTVIDSSSKEKECKNIEETKELKGVQNLTNWYEYKFGGTYRSLNNSTDSSICSTPSRHNSLLGLEDSSLNEPFQQQQYEFCPVYLAPTRLKRSPNKISPFLKEKSFNDVDKNCQTIDSYSGLKRLTVDCSDKSSLSPLQRFLNCSIYGSPAMYSTPVSADSQDKNSCMYKKDTKQTTKYMRRSSCGSLIQQFVDLDISNEANDVFNMQRKCHSDEVIYDDHVESVSSTDTQSVVSVSSKNLSHISNTSKQSTHVFTKNEDPKECSISDEMQFFVTTMEKAKDCTDTILESIHETSPDCGNNTNGFKKSVLVNLTNTEELQGILETMENSLEENNNVLQGNDFYTFTVMKPNDVLSDVCQNFNGKLIDSSKNEVVDSKKSTTAVSYTPISLISIIPSWRTFISCSLVVMLGYYLKSVIPPWITCAETSCMWYSYEEILDQYFSTRSKELPPL